MNDFNIIHTLYGRKLRCSCNRFSGDRKGWTIHTYNMKYFEKIGWVSATENFQNKVKNLRTCEARLYYFQGLSNTTYWCQLSDGNHNITILVTHSFFHLVRYYPVVNWTAEVHLYHFLRKLNENIIIKMLKEIGALWPPIKVHFIPIIKAAASTPAYQQMHTFCQKSALILPAIIYEGVQKWRYLCQAMPPHTTVRPMYIA